MRVGTRPLRPLLRRPGARPALALSCPHHQRRSLQTEVGTHLLKGPPGFVPPDTWVQETERQLTLVHAHPWYPDRPNTEADNSIDAAALFRGRRVALFGIPAPFTGTCTGVHVPAYQALQDDFVGKVDELVCFSVSDPYAMDACGPPRSTQPHPATRSTQTVHPETQACWWAGRTSMGVDPSKITFLTDPEGKATAAWGLEKELRSVSLGVRSTRFSMLVEDGEVLAFNLVEDAAADAQVLLGQCS